MSDNQLVCLTDTDLDYYAEKYQTTEEAKKQLLSFDVWLNDQLLQIHSTIVKNRW
jgi:hypothetical protein